MAPAKTSLDGQDDSRALSTSSAQPVAVQVFDAVDSTSHAKLPEGVQQLRQAAVKSLGDFDELTGTIRKADLKAGGRKQWVSQFEILGVARNDYSDLILATRTTDATVTRASLTGFHQVSLPIILSSSDSEAVESLAVLLKHAPNFEDYPSPRLSPVFESVNTALSNCSSYFEGVLKKPRASSERDVNRLNGQIARLQARKIVAEQRIQELTRNSPDVENAPSSILSLSTLFNLIPFSKRNQFRSNKKLLIELENQIKDANSKLTALSETDDRAVELRSWQDIVSSIAQVKEAIVSFQKDLSILPQIVGLVKQQAQKHLDFLAGTDAKDPTKVVQRRIEVEESAKFFQSLSELLEKYSTAR